MTVIMEFVDDLKRRCGSCSLCCTLLPVGSLGKGAGERCRHQRFSAKGACCRVYERLERVAPDCRLWNCRWIVGSVPNSIGRPDRVHYVVDMIPDFITIEDLGDEACQEVVQVWLDPKHPDAHRDSALRAWLDAEKRIALVRLNADDAFVLCPPSRSATCEWIEHYSSKREASHTFAQVVEALS